MRYALVILLAGALGCSNVPKGSYGQVCDLDTGKPIPGAQLAVHRVGEHRTPVATESGSSNADGTFVIEKKQGLKLSHVVARAGGYYPAVGVRRGRIYLRPVPEGAQPMRAVEYIVKLDDEAVGLRLRDGAIVPADEADVIVAISPEPSPWSRAVTVAAKGGIRRIVSPMPHGVAREPRIAFDNIVEVPRTGYSKRRSKGTWDYGWGAYSTYAVRTLDRSRHAKLLVAGYLDENGETARVIVRYRVADPDAPRFVAATPERTGS